jgi:hypothetical protein
MVTPTTVAKLAQFFWKQKQDSVIEFMKRDIFPLTMDSSSDNAITEQETFLLRTTVNGKVQDLCVLVSRNLHNLLIYIHL